MKDKLNVGVNKNSVASVYERDIESVALLSKLVSDKKDYKYNSLYSGKHKSGVKAVKNDLTVTNNILELFPDVELGLNMLITAALQPQDAATTVINYKVDGILPPDITSRLISILKSEIEENYKEVSSLDKIAERCLMGKGADVYVTIPENVIDMIINGEGGYLGDLKKKLNDSDGTIKEFGILGSKSTEGYDELTSFNVEVTDNFTLVSARNVHECSKRVTRSLFTNTLGNSAVDVVASLEGDKLKITRESIYKNVQGKNNEEIDLKPMRLGARESVGRCTIYRPTVESTIVVHRPGDPEDHIGYFILYGENGYPVNASVSTNDNEDPYKGLSERFKNSVVGKQIQTKASAKYGSTKNDLSTSLKYYTETIERYLLSRLTEGYSIDDASLGDNRDIYQVMLARTLKGRSTKVVFVPYELCTYFATDYKDNGTGMNKVTGLCKLASIRAKLMYAKLLTEIRKGIRNTNVNVSLDPNDPDVPKTIEILQADILENRQLDKSDLDTVDPKIITSFLHKAGISFSYSNHPGLPQVKLDFTDTTIEGGPSDDNYAANIKEAMLNKIGVTGELIDGGLSPDFASSTSYRINNFLKRVMKVRTSLTGHATHLVQSIALNDKIIQDKLLEVIKEVKGIDKLYNVAGKEDLTGDDLHNDILLNFIKNVKLDVIDTNASSDVSVLYKQYEKYKTAVDEAIEAWLSRDMLTEVDIDTDDAEHLVSVVKSYFLRKWQADNGYLVELGDICTRNSGGEPVIKLDTLMIEHTESLLNTIGNYIKKTKPKDKTDSYSSGGDSGYGGYGGGSDTTETDTTETDTTETDTIADDTTETDTTETDIVDGADTTADDTTETNTVDEIDTTGE